MPKNKTSLLLSTRPFYQAQAKEAAALHQRCFQEFWSEASMSTLLQNPCVHGFFTYTPCKSDPIGLLLGQIIFEDAEIYTLATQNEYRRQGVASHLLEKFIVECLARSVKRILLEVHEANVPALRFYERVGFVAYGRREKYYASFLRDYSDAILFEMAFGSKKQNLKKRLALFN